MHALPLLPVLGGAVQLEASAVALRNMRTLGLPACVLFLLAQLRAAGGGPSLIHIGSTHGGLTFGDLVQIRPACCRAGPACRKRRVQLYHLHTVCVISWRGALVPCAPGWQALLEPLFVSAASSRLRRSNRLSRLGDCDKEVGAWPDAPPAQALFTVLSHSDALLAVTLGFDIILRASLHARGAGRFAATWPACCTYQ
jgi:hypothetical protein